MLSFNNPQYNFIIEYDMKRILFIIWNSLIEILYSKTLSRKYGSLNIWIILLYYGMEIVGKKKDFLHKFYGGIIMSFTESL